MSKQENKKEKNNIYLEELNDSRKEIMKLRNERDGLVIKYYLMEQEANKNGIIICQLKDYIYHLLNEPTYKSYGGTLAEIRDILEGKFDE